MFTSQIVQWLDLFHETIPQLQLLVTVLLLVIFLLYHRSHQPYRTPQLNQLESTCLFMLLMEYIFLLLFMSPRYPAVSWPGNDWRLKYTVLDKMPTIRLSSESYSEMDLVAVFCMMGGFAYITNFVAKECFEHIFRAEQGQQYLKKRRQALCSAFAVMNSDFYHRVAFRYINE